jgi:hypothetical protein
MSRVLQVDSTSVVWWDLFGGTGVKRSRFGRLRVYPDSFYQPLGQSRPSYVWSPEMSDQRGKLLPSRLATGADH